MVTIGPHEQINLRNIYVKVFFLENLNGYCKNGLILSLHLLTMFRNFFKCFHIFIIFYPIFEQGIISFA